MPSGSPIYADVHPVTHQSGVALWEVWLPAPRQPFDARRWIGWLDPDNDTGLVARLWEVLGPIQREITGKPPWSGLYFPLTLLRSPDVPLETLIGQYGEDLVHLLFLDRSYQPFKPELVAEELSRDYCARAGGMTLFSRRSGLDVHGLEAAGEEKAATDALPPRSSLPFLITVELLLIERTVLSHLYQRLSQRMPSSVEALLALQQTVLDALEQYYGAITKATRFSDAVTRAGEELLGLGDLYKAVRDRLDTVSFAITTRYQKRITLLQFWLTVVFGGAQIGI